jgi:hypothetical protein
MFLRFLPRNEASRSGEKNASLQVAKKQRPRCICLDQGAYRLHISGAFYPTPRGPHECESCDIPSDESKLRVCAKKEISSSPIGRFLCCALLLSSCSTLSLSQNTEAKVPPVIDVHVHAMDGTFPGVAPMCPNTSKFTASDPKGKEEPFGWVKEQCTPALYPSAPGEYMKDVLAEVIP